MAINVYTVSALLDLLGIDDFGTFSVIGGVTAFAVIISGAMASGAQRFFAIEIGRRDDKRLSEVFNTTNMIYWVISLVILLLFESVGLWFVNTRMVFDAERMVAVNWVYQFSLFTLIANVLSTPYNALLIAHEKMSVFSIIAIADNLLKLAIVVALPYMGSDRLIVYAGLLCGSSIFIRIVYQLYCWRRFVETRFRYFWDSELVKQLLSYSSYNMIGLVANIARNHGINIITNIFFGTTINAARAISTQIGVILNTLVNNLYISSRPQITKYYATGESGEMWSLTYISAKAAYYLLMVISIPFFIEVDYVMELWLVDYPPLVPTFIRLTIIVLLIEATSNQLFAVLQAANKIKHIQLTSSIVLLLNLPVAYLFFVCGADEISPFYISIFISILYIASLIYVAKRDVGLDVGHHLRVVASMLLITVIAFCGVYGVSTTMESSFLRVVITSASSLIIGAATIWLLGINPAERRFIMEKVKLKYE